MARESACFTSGLSRGPLAVDREHVETRVERTFHPRGRIGDHPLLLIGRKLGDDVHLALQESGHARSRLGNGAHDEPVEVRLAPQ